MRRLVWIYTVCQHWHYDHWGQKCKYNLYKQTCIQQNLYWQPPFPCPKAFICRLPLTVEAVYRVDHVSEFCTPWPKQLDKQSQIRHHFPLEVIVSDYCFSAPSIRDPRSRGVSITFQLTDLKLDKHSKDKFIRLVGPRYSPRSGSVIIMSDRCPIKKQNYDYCMYLLTALYFESWKVEPWESEKTLEDMEEYVWEINPSKAKVVHILQQCQQEDQGNPDVGDSKLLYLADKPVSDETVLELEPVKKYKEAVEDLVNSGEATQTLEEYKQSVLQMLHKNTAAPPP